MDETQVVIEIPQDAYKLATEAIIKHIEYYDDVDSERVSSAAQAALHAALPVVLAAAYTELADQLTELAEHMRQEANDSGRFPFRAAGLVEGITVIRERAARLSGSGE